jgi:D-sedoheptulose 7-phosphate isomerase
MSLGPTTDLGVRARDVMGRSAAVLDALTRDEATLTAVVRLAKAVWLFGNGGSAADAQHFAAELVGRFLRDRRPLPAEALTANSSIVTGLANDYGFEQIFARQLAAGACAGDVAIGISTLGRSANVAEGLKSARGLGVFTAALTGGDGGLLADLADVCIIVPATETPRIQECHAVVAHVICELVEDTLPR